jgi:glucan biosynthesis protein
VDRQFDQFLDRLSEFHNDPLGWVENAFPWGEGELRRANGPEPWQAEILGLIRDGLSPDRAVAIAVASGHGIGKSTLIAWIILWSLSTETDTRVVVTANTEANCEQRPGPNSPSGSDSAPPATFSASKPHP